MKKFLLVVLATSLQLHAQTIGVEAFATGFTGVTEITNAGDERLFVAQQNGQIRIVDPTGQINPTPFLTISNLITSSGEAGLLGLAFHPNYIENGYFYVNYSQSGTLATKIARYQVNPNNPDQALADSGTVLLTIEQPFSNHNGGCLRFGPDGYLYIATGDGGSAGDPGNRAQNTMELLGKMLRIDVDNEELYAIPSTNPYVEGGGALEIFYTGMRNPWKFAFDSETGELWIADVGQNAVEEINKVQAPYSPGLNFGWRCYEGNVPYNTNGCQSASSYFMPIAQYNHGSNLCSITGGTVHRNELYPGLNGKYFFGDYCSNRIGTVDQAGTLTWHTVTGFGGNTRVFGEDINGQLYVNSGASAIMKIVDLDQTGLPDTNRAAFEIAPNPVKDELYIRSLTNESISKVYCYSLDGKTIEINARTSEVYDLSGLQSGIYFLQLETSAGLKNSYRIVKE